MRVSLWRYWLWASAPLRIWLRRRRDPNYLRLPWDPKWKGPKP